MGSVPHKSESTFMMEQNNNSHRQVSPADFGASRLISLGTVISLMEKVKEFYPAEKCTTLNEQHRNLTRRAPTPTQVHVQARSQTHTALTRCFVPCSAG